MPKNMQQALMNYAYLFTDTHILKSNPKCKREKREWYWKLSSFLLKHVTSSKVININYIHPSTVIRVYFFLSK
jgi:hypothetical protein